MKQTERKSVLRRIAESPLFISGISLPIIIGGATTLRESILLSVAALYLTLCVTLFLKPFAQRLPTKTRRALSALVAAVCYIPFAYVVLMKFNHIYEAVGIFLPVLCVSSVIMYVPSEKEKYVLFSKELRYNITTTVSFCVAMCLVGAIRELLSQGTLLGVHILDNILVPDAAYPYVGFLLFGLLCALAQTLRNHVSREEPEEDE